MRLRPSQGTHWVFFNLRDQILPQGLGQLQEPLLRRAEDDRVLAAPAMRIGMPDVLLRKQQAALQKIGDDIGIALFEDMLPRQRGALSVNTPQWSTGFNISSRI